MTIPEIQSYRFTRPIQDVNLRHEFRALARVTDEYRTRLLELFEKHEKDGETFYNGTGTAFQPGSILTIAAGTVTLAKADAVGTIAYFICLGAVADTGRFTGVATASPVMVPTVGNANIVKNDPLWLSDTDAGKVQRDVPTTAGRFMQKVGYAVETEGREFDGTVLATIFIDPHDAVVVA